MCGIVGAVAERNVAHILLEGLKRLEYRGYDSAGIAIVNPDQQVERIRVLGKVAGLEKAYDAAPLQGYLGIAHTRWATHGRPNEANAHPHFSQNEIAVVHNGIIENFSQLREQLKAKGYKFLSETDTEVIAHLLHHHYQQSKDMIKTIQAATQELDGAYALGIVNSHEPDALYAVRKGSPLVIGVGIDEHFIASDALALAPVTQQFIYLEESDIVKLDKNCITIFDANGKPVERKIHHTDINADKASKGKYRHFMLKEIFEQPSSMAETINGNILNQQIAPQAFGHKAPEILAKVERITIVACGTSYHAGLVARYWIEAIANIPCQVEIASENRYRKGVIEPNSLFVGLSQSGETADTLAAFRKAKEEGYLATMSICNAAQSSMVREADLVFLTQAGMEVGVAATKTFTSQLIALLMLASTLKHQRNPSDSQTADISTALQSIPGTVKEALLLDQAIQTIAKQFADKHHALFLGRGTAFPIALEGALKLKEISYVHAEAYPGGELKHGPLALIDKEMPVIVIAPKDDLIEKMASNIQEVQARGGEIYIFSDDAERWENDSSVAFIKIPSTPAVIAPIIYSIPMQLLAYHVAVLKGTDIDQPRNLAKSVTVE